MFCISALCLTAYAQTDPEEPKKDKKGKKEKKEGKDPALKSKAEDKRHHDKIAKSKKTGKATTSRDTLYCGGKPYCTGKEVSKNLLGTVIIYNFKAFKQTEPELTATLETVSSGANAVYYWVWTNGTTRFETEQKDNPLEMVCYYYLFNDSTLNVKNFNTFKQSKAKTISGYNGGPAPKPKSDDANNRNRNDKVTFSGRDIRQSSVLIGHIESITSTQSGSIITTYTIYNTSGNLVATAKNHGVTDHEWDIVTSNDNRTHHVTSSLLHDQEDIVKQLVDLLYL